MQIMEKSCRGVCLLFKRLHTYNTFCLQPLFHIPTSTWTRQSRNNFSSREMKPFEWMHSPCFLNVLKLPDHLLSEGSVSSAPGCVSCCVWVSRPARTVWSVCTVWAVRNTAAGQSCMDYRRHAANFTIRTIRLTYRVSFLQLSHSGNTK